MNKPEKAWDWLIDNGVVSEETLKVVTNINGFNNETMEDVLYAVTGERAFPWGEEDE